MEKKRKKNKIYYDQYCSKCKILPTSHWSSVCKKCRQNSKVNDKQKIIEIDLVVQWNMIGFYILF